MITTTSTTTAKTETTRAVILDGGITMRELHIMKKDITIPVAPRREVLREMMVVTLVGAIATIINPDDQTLPRGNPSSSMVFRRMQMSAT